MPSLCTTALNECIQAAQLAQSAVVQCSSLATALVSNQETSHSHIAHSTSTFSELGIGAAIAMLLDPLRWKEKLGADAVTREELRSKTVTYGWFVRKMIGVLTHPIWRVTGLYIVPVAIILLGIFALFGVAGFFPKLSETLCFWLGFLSFIVTMFTAFILSRSARGSVASTENAEKKKSQTIPYEINN